jgi:hypothetical protein
VAALFAGPLFPWSPLKPGYTHFVMHRADAYYPSGTILEEPYQALDTLIDEAEKFHRLKMPDRITVITPSSWSAFRRHAPWEGSNAIAALTLQTGTVIYVTPKIAEKHIDTTEFLRHELSHAIIDQNTTLWRGHKLNAQPWLYEGLAVDFGNQKSYLTRAEFLERARTRPLAPVFNGDNSDMRFNYVAWRYFLDFLISTRGRDKFQEYLLGAMQDPDRARAMFPEYFKILFDDAVREFQATVGGGGPS